MTNNSVQQPAGEVGSWLMSYNKNIPNVPNSINSTDNMTLTVISKLIIWYNIITMSISSNKHCIVQYCVDNRLDSVRVL